MCELESQSQSGSSSKEIQESHDAAQASSVDHPQQKPNPFHNGVAADNVAQTPAPGRPEQEQDSPFLRLPSELRLTIYDFALQDILDDMTAQDKASSRQGRTYKDHPKPLPFIGVLAILHTSRALRTEGADTMRLLAEAEYEQLSQDEIRTHAELHNLLEPTSNETCDLILETTARCDATRAAVDDSDRLLKTLRKVARAELLSRLSRLRVEYDWSAGDLWQKRQLIAQWVWTLSDAECEALSDPDVGDLLDYLVEFVDSGVGMRGREESSAGGRRALDQVQLGLFYTRDDLDSEW